MNSKVERCSWCFRGFNRILVVVGTLVAGAVIALGEESTNSVTGTPIFLGHGFPRYRTQPFTTNLSQTGLTNAAVDAGKTSIAPPADAFKLRRWEMIPPAAPPRVVMAQFPITTPILSVESMVWCDNRLWIAARPRTVPQVPASVAKLWVYDPDSNRLEAVPGLIEKNEVHGMIGGGRRLWLSLEGGAGSLDTQSLAVEPFSAQQGLTANHLAGLGESDGAIFAFGRSGAVFRLAGSGTNFTRSGGLVFPGANGGPEPWERATASRQWLLASSAYDVATRHADAPQWTLLRDELSRGSPRLERPRIWSVESDGEGGFWLGSDSGLHWVHPEDGAVENRFMPGGVLVPGGFGVVMSAWQKPTEAIQQMARQRIMNGIRDRMRMRARFARLSAESHSVMSPVVPTSRMTGGVTAMLRDKNYLWIASTDGRNTNQSRILLYQPTSRKWVGWFAVPYPVHSLAANERVLFLGMEVPSALRISALAAVEKFPLTAIPSARWVDDVVSAAEIDHRIMGMPPKERNVYWFFSGQPQRVVEALAPDGKPSDDIDAESLFLLTFAHDVAGLDQPDKFAAYAALLGEKHPGSIYAELTRSLAPSAREPETNTRVNRKPAPPSGIKPMREETPAEGAMEPENATEILARRDLDGDGKLNPVEFHLWKGDDADFKVVDLNQDGFLDASEIEAMIKGK